MTLSMTFTRCQYTNVLALAHPINSDHGDRTMKRLPARILIVALTFCLAFTSLPILTGELSSHAASKPTLKGSLNSNNKPHLTWTKASKAYNGYAVFKNGAVYKRFNKKTLSFIDTAAGDGQTNTYQIKTYKSKKKIKKTKQWYNKQTKKWQTKKPAKKYRGKKRTVKKTTYKYSYKMASNPFAITTKVKITCTSHTYSAATCTSPKTCSKCGTTEGSALGHNWGAWYVDKPATTSAEGVEKRTCARCGKPDTRSIPKITNTTPTVVNPEVLKTNPYKNWDDDPYAIGSTVTMTDYKNKTRTFTKNYKNRWVTENYVITDLTGDSLLCFNKDVDGEWTAAGGTKMLNYHGTTFNMGTFGEYGMMSGNTDEFNVAGDQITGGHGYSIIAYNLNKNLLQITPKDATIEAVKTYTNEKVPKECIKYFYMKDNFRIAPAMSDSKTFLVFNNKEIDIEFDPSSSSPGDATGFYTTTINFEVKYDNKIIGTVVADTRDVLKYKGYNTSKIEIGRADPIRSKCVEIVKAALGKNATFNYDIDKQTIKNYINNTYQYEEDIYSENGEFLFCMNCIGGALCLETYSALYLNEYGFRTPRGGGVNHTSYSLNSNPTQYFSIQGGK